ncbi:MAG: hypothetical protein IJ341_12765 [Bacteroidales bacterium]|nr:hypothetical protein [Bacteroidales bacterium]
METDNDKPFEKLVDKIFLRKWREAVNAGSLITCTMADQIRRQAIKEAQREYANHQTGWQRWDA